MRRTKKEAEQTKQAILLAALDVFDKKSYDTATLSNIAKKAGVTRGAIYWHFENKFDILKELMDKYYGEFLNNIFEKMSENNESALDTIRIIFNSYVTEILENPETLKFRRVIELKISFTEDTEQINELFGRFKSEILNKLIGVIKIGQEKNEIRGDMTAEFLGVSLMSWVFGYESMTLSPCKISEISLSDQSLIENLIKFIKA